MATLKNLVDQALDIAGSEFQTGSMVLADEPNFLGRAVSGQTGAAATITAGADVVVSDLTGMTAESIGRFLTITGADTAGNNGTFLIVEYVDATSVKISNASAATDANNGTIGWTERRPYSLEDDLNFERTDRAAIKGVNYYAAVPTYTRPTATGTAVDANLANIAGKTTDAKALVVTRLFQNASVAAADGYITVTSAGNLKHADATDRTGVPINDGADAGADEATYVDIIADGLESGLRVLAGPQAGWRVFGRTRAGTTGTSPNSVEVEFRAVAVDAALSTSVAYAWEAGQPTTIDLYYGYRERLDQMSETALRVTLANGVIADSSLQADINDVRTVIGVGDAVTDLAGLLTNTTTNFVFSDLPDATPSVVEALNTLNTQIGDRNYTSTLLTDGATITTSLEELATAIAQASSLRVIERLASDIPAGTAHTIPGANTYTVDGTNNGQNMWVFWRGLLQDPGPISGGNDYAETSTTSITPYTRIKAGDHINYFIVA
jgi:hypothetical protein